MSDLRRLKLTEISWSSTFQTKNWPTDYSCPGERLHQFWFFYAFLYSSYETVWDRHFVDFYKST